MEEIKSLYDDLISKNQILFDEIFANFYDLFSKDNKALVYITPLVKYRPHLIIILEKYFKLRKLYQDEEIEYITGQEPEENKNKTLSFIGCYEKCQ